MQKKILSEVKYISVKALRNNVGQLADMGVQANPRRIDKQSYNKLKTSLFENDLNELKELLVYPLNDTYVVLSGNMRLKAYKELEYSEVKCKVIDTSVNTQTLQRIIIVENTNHGTWDEDMLANEWEPELLDAWGYDLPEINIDALSESDDQPIDVQDSFLLKVKSKKQDEIMSLLRELQDRGFEVEIRNE
tara:strand:+ start:1762 stop:2334 length:573 start_codon:yes stop_codon:yes gene_type:complete